MRIVKPSFEIINMTGGGPFELLKVIEQAGRVCYKSEDKITIDSHEKFIKSILSRGHEAVVEHGTPQEARAVLPNSLKTEML